VHSLPGDCKEDRGGGGLSGHGRKVTELQALTLWRPQRDGLVMTCKKRCLREGHSLPGDHRGMDLSAHRMKATEQEHSLP